MPQSGSFKGPDDCLIIINMKNRPYGLSLDGFQCKRFKSQTSFRIFGLQFSNDPTSSANSTIREPIQTHDCRWLCHCGRQYSSKAALNLHRKKKHDFLSGRNKSVGIELIRSKKEDESLNSCLWSAWQEEKDAQVSSNIQLSLRMEIDGDRILSQFLRLHAGCEYYQMLKGFAHDFLKAIYGNQNLLKFWVLDIVSFPKAIDVLWVGFRGPRALKEGCFERVKSQFLRWMER